MALKIYSDQSILPEGIEAAPILKPFWGERTANTPFARYAEKASTLFESTDLETAQFAVAPADWKFMRRNEAFRQAFVHFLESVARHNKKTLLFFEDDSEEIVSLEGLLVFRPSISKSKIRDNEIPSPAWIRDWNEKGSDTVAHLRKKGRFPVVGFCGYAHGGFGPNRRFRQHFRWLYARLRQRCFGKSLGKYNRGMALRLLAKSKHIRTHFQINDAFFVKMLRAQPGQYRVLRRAFHQNMVDSDYVLCVRGSGNFSYRFYEALCCGRIPVLVDTDCALPWGEEIDYKKHCVWVPENEITTIAERIVEFHDALTPEAFISLQQRCRDLWRRYLSAEGFFTQMSSLLKKQYLGES